MNIPDPDIDYAGYIAYISANYIRDVVNMNPRLLEGNIEDKLIIGQGLLNYLNTSNPPLPSWTMRISNANSGENIMELTERFIQQLQAYKNSLNAQVDPFGVAVPRRGMTPTLPPNAGLNSAETGEAGFRGGKSRRSKRRNNKKRKSTRRR